MKDENVHGLDFMVVRVITRRCAPRPFGAALRAFNLAGGELVEPGLGIIRANSALVGAGGTSNLLFLLSKIVLWWPAMTHAIAQKLAQ